MGWGADHAWTCAGERVYESGGGGGEEEEKDSPGEKTVLNYCIKEKRRGIINKRHSTEE